MVLFIWMISLSMVALFLLVLVSPLGWYMLHAFKEVLEYLLLGSCSCLGTYSHVIYFRTLQPNYLLLIKKIISCVK